MSRDENFRAPSEAQADEASPEAIEAALDGVRYARLCQDGAFWRLGSLSPLWREEAAGLAPKPDAQALEALAGRGIWLAPDIAAPHLAVMCCGLGSVWPGMGRELYDNFPAAREAMDRIAALADWDVLGLMDERDAEIIGHTRRQIPYLFLLEYAQWSQFASLGIAPALFCGHSLGELIALSLAGIYGLNEAWCILDTRAEHMAELEAAATHDTGMMAVHTEGAVIDEILAAWPELYVSNRNTPRQFILSGPRQSLAEARASLRKKRVPAMLLNVSLAFHHPGMRILRDLSQRRLNSLEMHAPAVPMLSGITAGHYPDDQPSICRYITDLDENTVLWTDCVNAMWRRDGIRHFLELGPQDTLCGLVMECEPRALCLSAGRKGNEVKAMREACARLYALGHLSWPLIARRSAERSAACADSPAGEEPATAPQLSQKAQGENFSGEEAGKAGALLDLLAEACGKPASALRFEHDLRYDLALRSSRFPLLLQEAESRLGVHAEFESLLQATTVGDLVHILLGRPEKGERQLSQGAEGVVRPRHGPFPPLLRFEPPQGMTGKPLGILPLDPAGYGPKVRSGGVYALCVFDDLLLPELWSGLAPFAATLAVPAGQMAACQPLVQAGSRLVPLETDFETGAEDLCRALDSLVASCGRLDGLLLVPPAAGLALKNAPPHTLFAETCAAWLHRQSQAKPWFACLRRWLCSIAETGAILEGRTPDLLSDWLSNMASIGASPVLALLDDGRPLGRDALGDALAQELFCGKGESVLLSLPLERASQTPKAAIAPLLDRPEIFSPVYPQPWAEEKPALAPESGLFQGGCQFSRFADPELAQHGAWGAPADALGWLPFSRVLLALLQGARMLLPWLVVTGFTDVRFFSRPLLARGITREGRISSRARPWIRLDGSMTRMCRTGLSLRELTANGRHTDSFAPLGEAMVLLAAGSCEAPPLLPLESSSGAEDVQGPELPLSQLYARLRIGPDWRLVARLVPLRSEGAGEAPNVHMGQLEFASPGADAVSARKPASIPIAPHMEWGYAQALRWTAAVMESALLVLEHEAALSGNCERSEDDGAPHCAWQCCGVGFIRFNVEGIESVRENTRPALELRRTWHDGARARFDGQIFNAGGDVLLTVHHIEFVRQEKIA